mmetsp:Transcript_3753/g.17271  ORF Transcript_3753/g.17271 Transcript_3753/m.17271 type:complete len:201 (+) Transcript_3753:206-808(+)
MRAASSSRDGHATHAHARAGRRRLRGAGRGCKLEADSTRRRSAQVHGIRRGRVARQRRRRYPPDRAKRPDAHAPQHHETQERTICPSRRGTKQGEHVRVRRDRLRLLAHRPRESLRRLRRPLPPAHAHGIRRDVLPQLHRRRRQDHQTSRRKRGGMRRPGGPIHRRVPRRHRRAGVRASDDGTEGDGSHRGHHGAVRAID